VTLLNQMRTITWSVILIAISSCVSSHNVDEKYGINQKRIGFVPARIALLPCMVWPSSATKLRNLPAINRPEDETKSLCEELDKYVADGFDNQPFMKGLSPKLVEKMYSKAGLAPEVPTAIAAEWKSKSDDCKDCITLPAIYNLTLKNRPSWQIWLTKISSATNGADAIMVPVILSTNTRVENDRGILQSIRSGAIAILLIDTNDGDLIWSGGRQAEVNYKAFANSTSGKQMPEPPLDDLKRRLLTDAIWLEFPGRQIFR